MKSNAFTEKEDKKNKTNKLNKTVEIPNNVENLEMPLDCNGLKKLCKKLKKLLKNKIDTNSHFLEEI